MINGRPCMLIDVLTNKNIHPKEVITGIDIFTSKVLVSVQLIKDRQDVPDVWKKEYTILSINNDGYMELVT